MPTTPLLTTCCVLGLMFPLRLYAGDPVKADDLPEAVKTTMNQAANGAALSNIEKSIGRKGKAVYTAQYSGKKGKMITITVSEDGKKLKNSKSDPATTTTTTTTTSTPATPPASTATPPAMPPAPDTAAAPAQAPAATTPVAGPPAEPAPAK